MGGAATTELCAPGGRARTIVDGEAADSIAASLPLHLHATHRPSSMTSWGGPNPEILATDRRASPAGGSTSHGHHPGPDRPAMQGDAQHGSLRHRNRRTLFERRRNQIVELAANGGHVGHHSHHPSGGAVRRWLLPRRRPPRPGSDRRDDLAQSPSAALRASARSVRSHVKPSPVRPKCP